MGQQAECTATHQGKVSEGRALLETDALVFRGDFRLVIPYTQMTAVQAADGVLIVRFPGGTASFALGPKAAQWADRILHPKSRMDKLGVKSGQRVAVLGVNDPAFLGELRAATPHVVRGRRISGASHVFVQADERADLRRVASAARMIGPTGSVWLVTPRGAERITEADALAAGRAAGLTDIKVVRFSGSHTAHKFVIPRSRRVARP